MDQPLPHAVALTAFADAWPRAIETEIGAALCVIGRGKGLLTETILTFHKYSSRDLLRLS